MKARSFAISIPFLAVTLFGTTDAAHAQWTPDGIALCSAANDQLIPPGITTDGAGGAIVVWEDYRSGGADIYAQRIDAAGVPQWKAGGLALCTAVNNQIYPRIASDGAGGAIITWTDNRSGKYDIYAQRVNSAGVSQWAADGIAVCIEAHNQSNSIIATDGAGGAIVAWRDYRNSVDGDLYVQRVDANGVPLWIADGIALCTEVDAQLDPMIAPDGSGGAIVTWDDYRAQRSHIYAQKVNAAGESQWTTGGVALCIAANDQLIPQITTDGAEGAIVTWQDYRSGVNHAAYVQRVSSAGVPLWTPNGVALCDAVVEQDSPVITSDEAGGAIISWRDGRDSTGVDIYAQRLNPAGVAQWTTNGVALSSSANNKDSPAITSDGAGGAIVTWMDSRTVRFSYDIYAQRVNPVGVPQWTSDGVALCTAPYSQSFPTITSDGAEGAIVAWTDNRTYCCYDIHAQRVGSNGGTVAVPPAVSEAETPPSARPNPSRGQVSLDFSLRMSASVRIGVFDVAGRRVRGSPIRLLEPGRHNWVWDGNNDDGKPVRAGIYVVRVDGPDTKTVLRVVRE